MDSYLRIYSDNAGESHLEDVGLTYELRDFVPPAPPVALSSFQPASQFGVAKVPPGWQGDWHPTPKRELVIYLTGEGEIEASDGEVRALRPGTILLAEDTTGKGHRTRVTGSNEVTLVLLLLPD